MIDNAATEQSEPDPAVVIWPEPSRLEPWWQRVMFGSGTGQDTHGGAARQ
ncbi:hypothetical protein IU433_30815 [Nocardia puris]|uniref:Uncharacterized protein n=1 Tax=Nocardia puris TaxID=208602 RepID=A0A366D0F6_9NOCA|nr:hypothetical protein [Nocardia puris]MBF6215224.1 hypothetical protein [Nocardia puris]MBF6369726.1 hypothetical protein [Nocardia puris]MBF6463394.1 hypothetical protein [Nocardia puris]RBO82944.1 hypothetical protein DFR74_12134 [Nocardia puris]